MYGNAVQRHSEDDLKGPFDDLDVNSSKLGPTVSKRNEKLVKLLDTIGDLPLTGGFFDNSIDLFIGASAEFTRSDNKNKLTVAHQQKLLDVFTHRQDIEHFARLIENDKIAANGYNIAVSSYVEQKDERVAVDITALNATTAGIVSRQATLRTQIDAICRTWRARWHEWKNRRGNYSVSAW